MISNIEQQKVITHIKSVLSYDGEITSETRLFHDLGLYGDDVDMLFMSFEDELGLNISKVNLETYFYMQEGPSFGNVMNRMLKIRDPKKKPPLKVGHVIRGLQMGSLYRALEEDLKKISSS